MKIAFSEVGIELELKGTGVSEKANVIKRNNPEFKLKVGKDIFSIDPTYFQSTEVDLLIGGPTKAKEKLGWIPEHNLESLLKDMIQSDVNFMQKQEYLNKSGYLYNINFE